MTDVISEPGSELIDGLDHICSLPNVFHQINGLVQDPRCSISDIGRVVAQDAGLAARLLRIANSALYAFPSPIETISRAITIIGTRQIRDLTLATSIIEAFCGQGEELLRMEDFWCHNIGCGVTARVIATYRQEPNPERFFVAGLLHDVGRMVLLQQLPDQSRALFHAARQQQRPVWQLEGEFCGCDHSAVGGLLLNRWRLPDSLVEPVRWHHQPNQAVRYPLETAVIHLADIISHALELGHSGSDYAPPLLADAWQLVALPVSLLSQITAQVERQYEEAVALFLPGRFR